MILEILFPYIIAVHVGTIFIIIGLILWADYHAFAWVRGKKALLEIKQMTRIHTLMWWGLIIMIISGGLLFYPYKDFLATLFAFRLKMLFVVALIINSFYIGTVLPIATQKPFAEISLKQKLKLGISGAASAISWVGAIITGTMLGL